MPRNLIRLPRGRRRHATQRDDRTMAMCGRDVNGRAIIVNDGDPDCAACLTAIARAIAAGDDC